MNIEVTQLSEPVHVYCDSNPVLLSKVEVCEDHHEPDDD